MLPDASGLRRAKALQVSSELANVATERDRVRDEPAFWMNLAKAKPYDTCSC